MKEEWDSTTRDFAYKMETLTPVNPSDFEELHVDKVIRKKKELEMKATWPKLYEINNDSQMKLLSRRTQKC